MTETERQTPETQAQTQRTSHVRPLRSSARKRMLRAATLAIAAAMAAASWAICVPALGLDLAVGAGVTAQTIGIASVVIAPLVAGGAAWGLLAILERTVRRARRVWTIIGCAVLALSLLGPLTMGAAGAVLVALLVIHLVVGATLIIGLRGSATAENRVH